MQTLKIKNYGENNILDNTQLLVNYNAGSSSITVSNANDFSNGYLLIGDQGSKTAELLPYTPVTGGTSITLTSPTILNHNQYDPVYSLFGNQIKIYRAANVDGSVPADGSFSLLATVNIDSNDSATSYNDSSGGGDYWYKFTYYNSGNSAETDRTAATAYRGSFTVNYASLDEIRREAGFRFAPYIVDDQIDEARQAAQDKINGSLDDFYQTPFQPPISDQIRRLTRRLAAGYLRQAQYSQISDAKINGDNIVKDALADLKKLQQKQEVVVNKAGQALDQVGGTGEADGWPDQTAATTAGSEGGAPRVFRMSDIQGRPLTTDSSGNPVGNLYYGRRW